jgi:hypothetical protein
MSSSATPSLTPSATTRPRNCTRPTPCRPPANTVPGRHGQPQPVDRGQGRHRESTTWPAADHLRRDGQHRPLGHCARLLQATGGQRRRRRDRRDQGPRARAHDRQWLARGRRHRPRHRQAFHAADRLTASGPSRGQLGVGRLALSGRGRWLRYGPSRAGDGTPAPGHDRRAAGDVHQAPTARVAQRGRTDGIQKAHQGHHCDPCE